MSSLTNHDAPPDVQALLKVCTILPQSDDDDHNNDDDDDSDDD